MGKDAAHPVAPTEEQVPAPGHTPAPARSVRAGGDEEYDFERLTLDSLRRLRGRGLLVLLGVATLLAPLVGWHVERMLHYRDTIDVLDQDIQTMEAALWELEEERLPLLGRYHGARREVKALRRERQSAAREYPLLLLIPFGLVHGLLVILLLGVGLRTIAAPLLTGLMISAVTMVPFALPMMVEHRHSSSVALLLGLVLYAQLRHVLVAVPVAQEQGLVGVGAFGASRAALRPHGGSIYVAIWIAAFLFAVTYGASQALTNDQLLATGGLVDAIVGAVFQALPAILFLTLLIVMSREAHALVHAKDKHARAGEAGKVFA